MKPETSSTDTGVLFENYKEMKPPKEDYDVEYHHDCLVLNVPIDMLLTI